MSTKREGKTFGNGYALALARHDLWHYDLESIDGGVFVSDVKRRAAFAVPYSNIRRDRAAWSDLASFDLYLSLWLLRQNEDYGQALVALLPGAAFRRTLHQIHA